MLKIHLGKYCCFAVLLSTGALLEIPKAHSGKTLKSCFTNEH